MFSFTDYVVLVTGAAGNLGNAVARGFESAGSKLVLVDRAPDRLPRLFPEMVYSPDHFLAVSVDLTDDEAVRRMVEEAVQRFGRIDVLANVAGGYRAGTPVHETPFETWEFLLDLNARTVFTVSRAVVPHMLEQESGRIVNVSARAALKGGARSAAYSVSKSAVMRIINNRSTPRVNNFPVF